MEIEITSRASPGQPEAGADAGCGLCSCRKRQQPGGGQRAGLAQELTARARRFVSSFIISPSAIVGGR
jgi:hypothetical protein